MERKLYICYFRSLVGESTNDAWAKTRDLCVLAWKPLADTHLKEIAWTGMTHVGIQLCFFFFFFHRLYYSCLFFRKILTTKKPTITIKRAAILNLNANRCAGLSKAILWYVNVHLYVLNQIFLTVYIFFLSFFLFVFNLFIVLRF